MASPYLSLSRIAAAKDLRDETVDIPEWPNEDGTPGTLCFRQMSARDTMRMTRLLDAHPDQGMFIVIVLSAITEDGVPLFPCAPSDDEAELWASVAQLQDKNMEVLDRLQRIALRVNRMGGDPKKPSGVEAATSGSRTGSPSPSVM